MFHATSLIDKTAYITGASAGIGAAIAHQLAEAGANVVLGARRKEKCEAILEDLNRANPDGRFAALPLDVNDGASVDRFLSEAESTVGSPSVLVNNAGLALGADGVADAALEDWDLMLDTNTRAVFHLTRKVLPGMIARGEGDIAMITSIAGLDPYAGGSVYCASKAAVQAFALALREETLGKNIRVMAFDPGLVATEFSVVRFKGDEKKAKTPYEGLEPLTADDVADCVTFALTRPRRMCLDRTVILATAQAGTRRFHRAD